MRAAVYCRVSSEGQEKDGTSLQTQQEGCSAYCRARGYQVVKEAQEAFSGLTLERPVLAEIRALVREKRVDVLVVYCLDRLSRDPAHAIILIDELERHGCTLEAVAETIDSSDMGKLVTYVRGLAAKIEAVRKKEATGRGRKKAVELGQMPHGDGKGLYGYTWNGKKKGERKRLIQPYEAEVVRRIFTEAAAGRSLSQIRRGLRDVPSKTGGQWCDATIRRMIANPAYYGETALNMWAHHSRYGGIRPREEWAVLPDVTPPIITRKLWEAAQQAREGYHVDYEAHLAKRRRYLLTGHIFCACGGRMRGHYFMQKGREYRHYVCKGHCAGSSVRADDLEEKVWAEVTGMLAHPEAVLAAYRARNTPQEPHYQDRAATLRNRLKNFPRQEENLLLSLRQADTAEVRSSLLAELTQLKKEKAGLEAEVARLEAEAARVKRMAEMEKTLTQYCADAAEGAKLDSFERRRELLKQVAARITVYPDRYELQSDLALPTDVPNPPSPRLRLNWRINRQQKRGGSRSSPAT